jgi:hypothetical protein
MAPRLAVAVADAGPADRGAAGHLAAFRAGCTAAVAAGEADRAARADARRTWPRVAR